MPDVREEAQRMTETRISMDALDTKVSLLENDLGELNNSLKSLDGKFDQVMTSFASEFRAAIASLSSQFNDRQKTPWGLLISTGGLLLSVCIVIGGLAVTPIQSRISKLEDDQMPRREIEFRYSVNDRRIGVIEDFLKNISGREVERLTVEIENLRRENNLLKYPLKQ